MRVGSPSLCTRATASFRWCRRATDSGTRVKPTPLAATRDLAFNEAQLLARESEEAQLYLDMQADLVQQMLRRISVLKPWGLTRRGRRLRISASSAKSVDARSPRQTA